MLPLNWLVFLQFFCDFVWQGAMSRTIDTSRSMDGLDEDFRVSQHYIFKHNFTCFFPLHIFTLVIYWNNMISLYDKETKKEDEVLWITLACFRKESSLHSCSFPCGSSTLLWSSACAAWSECHLLSPHMHYLDLSCLSMCTQKVMLHWCRTCLTSKASAAATRT